MCDEFDQSDSSSFENDDIENAFDTDRPDWTDMGCIMRLPSYEDLTPEYQQRLTQKFADNFTRQHPQSGLKFFSGSLSDALNQSIFNHEDPRPLILYICHHQSINDNLFCSKFFESEKIVNLINDEYVVWPWDRTDDNTYYRFLELIIKTLGSQIASDIVSKGQSTNDYPLLLCLDFQKGQYNTLFTFDNTVCDAVAMYDCLGAISQEFISTYDENAVAIESKPNRWHIPKSSFEDLSRDSIDFKNIAKKININPSKISYIRKIENLIWSIQYDLEKRKCRHENETEIYFSCPTAVAKDILHNGFDKSELEIYRTDCKFHFSFEDKNPPTGEEKILIIFQKLFQQNNSTMYCNEQILPNYLIIYKQ